MKSEDSQLEVVIACHSPERALGRAVESVLLGNAGLASATVVAHNVPVRELAKNLPERLSRRVKWLSLQDGIASPAGPFSLGISQVTSPWLAVLGSDDYLQSGAVHEWLRRSHGTDAVATRLVHDNGQPVRTPPVRPLPWERRDAVKDRLYYRSAPLGAIRTGFVRDRNLRMDPGLATGEDLRFSTELWTTGRVAVQSSGPGYVIGSDAADRVTMRLAPLEEELQHVSEAWRVGGWAHRLNDPERTALATKYLRTHFFGAVHYRSIENHWLPGDREALAVAIALVLESAPEAAAPLSLAERRLLDALVDPSTSASEVAQLSKARRRFGSPATLVPRDPRYILHREAPLRFMGASALVR